MIIQGEKLAFALERLWGWPTKLARRAFPNFGEVHIVPHAKVPARHTLTNYLWGDPHGSRNWFLNWTGVDVQGVKWTHTEWPDLENFGEWALPGSRTLEGRPAQDGKVGPAQLAGGGRTFPDYQRIVLEAEGWKIGDNGVYVPDGDRFFEVRERFLDPRPAGTSVPSDAEGKTYADFMNEPLRDPVSRREIGPAFDFRAGVACGIEEAKQWVNDWICGGWNPQAEITPMNCPKWYISDRCQQTIWALKVWTGFDGDKGACKDPIDCLKGLSKTGLEYLAPGMLGAVRRSRGY